MTTTTSATLLSLADRVEAGSGVDRVLDAEIAVAALGFFELPPEWDGGPIGYGYTEKDGVRVHPGHGGDQLVPELLGSLDAAMTLVPPGWERSAMDADNGDALVILGEEQRDLEATSRAKTWPRAFVAASLRALAMEGGE